MRFVIRLKDGEPSAGIIARPGMNDNPRDRDPGVAAS